MARLITRWAPALAWLVVTALLWGCADDPNGELPLAPYDCDTERPTHGVLHVSVTLSAESPQVPVTLYKGDFENGTVLEEMLVNEAEVSLELPVLENYALTALYVDGPDTVLVLDAGYIGVSSKEYRYDRCWEADDADVDLRLRN